MSQHQAPRRRIPAPTLVLVVLLVPVVVLTVSTVTGWIRTGPEFGTLPGDPLAGPGPTAPTGTAALTGERQAILGAARSIGMASAGSTASTPPTNRDPGTANTPAAPGPRGTSVTAAPSGGTAPPPASRPMAPAAAASPTLALESQLLALTNAARTAAGCPALTVDPALTTAAAQQATDMVTRHYFDHRSPDGKGPADRALAAGYTGAVGENIAVGFSAPDAVMRGWLASRGHRANIVNCAYSVVGIGYDPGTVTMQWSPGAWVQVFGMG